ncbi:hypothetical protein AMTR_s00075p00170880 [Amborella trichopoda]|uniref:Uncharacterized protein n=1 Tax=Amborella trichopoda TaxID=13333 RepID=W1PAA1_AMBTC|nr:hypothetical protein AMTR_s00075p00170880 [Amborella trichopoda]
MTLLRLQSRSKEAIGKKEIRIQGTLSWKKGKAKFIREMEMLTSEAPFDLHVVDRGKYFPSK